MSKSWGPHDIGGQEGGPIDLSEHDTAHWEWQIDAMVRLALRRWAKSLAYTLISRGVISEQQLADQVQAVRARQEAQGLS